MDGERSAAPASIALAPGIAGKMPAATDLSAIATDGLASPSWLIARPALVPRATAHDGDARPPTVKVPLRP